MKFVIYKMRTIVFLSFFMILNSISPLAVSSANIDSLRNVIRSLEGDSKSKKNSLSLAKANKELLYFYSKNGNRDSVKHYLKALSKDLTELDRIGIDKLNQDEKYTYKILKNIHHQTQTIIYIEEGKYNLAQLEIKRKLEESAQNNLSANNGEAYSLLGVAYLYSKRPDEALASFRKASKIELQLEKENPKIGNYRFYVPTEGIVTAYEMMGKYKEANSAADTLLQILDNKFQVYKATGTNNPEEEFRYNFFRNRTTCISAMINVEMSNLGRAREQLDEVEKFVSNQLPDPYHPDFYTYYLTEAEYYLRHGKYDKAKGYIEVLTSRILPEKNFYGYALSNITLAKIMNAEGNSKEAFSNLLELYHENDSISATNFSSEIAEIQALYEVDKATMRAEKNEERLRNSHLVIFIISLICMFSIFITILVLRNKKRSMEKNKRLYEKNKEIEERNTKLEKLYAASVVDKEGAEDEFSPDEILMRKLNAYLLESQAFLDPNLTREDVASQIGTNRQYMIDAIKKNVGKTFGEYINSFRLKYAHSLIVDKRTKSISTILYESGFSTRATFYNQFKEMYGMTPGELRDILD